MTADLFRSRKMMRLRAKYAYGIMNETTKGEGE